MAKLPRNDGNYHKITVKLSNYHLLFIFYNEYRISSKVFEIIRLCCTRKKLDLKNQN